MAHPYKNKASDGRAAAVKRYAEGGFLSRIFGRKESPSNLPTPQEALDKVKASQRAAQSGLTRDIGSSSTTKIKIGGKSGIETTKWKRGGKAK